MNAIEIKHLSKQYPHVLAIDDLSLDIKEGEIFALLGHNGAGKTTLIKILSCLLRPTAGSIRILGKDIVEDMIWLKGQFNISPQETAIAPNLTVFENLDLIAKLYGSDATTATTKANELLMRFSLVERANDRAKTLSGGMQRKLSLAMALITDPKIIYLDEPTLGLDPEARRDLWNQIMKLKKQATILLTTHYLEEADYLADRIAIMKQGQLVALGTAHDLKAKYFAKKAVIITCKGIKDSLVKELMDQYQDVSVADQIITIKQDHLDYHDLLTTFVNHKVIIDNLTNKEATLDDVYLAINRGEKKVKSLPIAARNFKELLRDPITYILAILVPILLMVLFITINHNAGVNQIPTFQVETLTPGIIVFAFSFVMMFLGMLLTRDRKSSFLNRLFAAPIKAKDFILGYFFPFFVIAILQMTAIYIVAFLSGLAITIHLLMTLIPLLLIAIFSIATGILFGSILTEGQMGGVGSVFITVTQLFSGAWMDLHLIGGFLEKVAYALPFSHAIDAARLAIKGDYSNMLLDLLWVIGYTIILVILSVLAFKKNMRQ